jgi:hypothetical protein
MGPGVWQKLKTRAGRVLHTAGEMLYGATTFGWASSISRQRAEVERLFLLLSFGDLVGLPILPPYYTMRLLPYIVPVLSRWKRGLLRERDWTDLAELIEGVD